MSTNTELQALLTKMGGTPTEQDTNSDLIKKINEVYESGGSGGGSTEESPYFYVRFTSSEPAEGSDIPTFTADKTFAEITAAMESKILVGVLTGNYILANMQMTFSPYISMGLSMPTFIHDEISQGGGEDYYLIRLSLSINENDEVVYDSLMLPFGLPPITEYVSEGDVLTVAPYKNGVKWAPVPEELPAYDDASDGDTLQVTSNGGLRWGDAEVPHSN